MKHILKKVFSDFEYNNIQLSEDILFSERKGQEYFFSARYDEEQLIEFFNLPKTNEIIEIFERKQLENGDVKKNATLFIYIQTDNVESFYEKYRNTIFQIEEDQYFFRKHVIVYTLSGIRNINSTHNISEELHRILTVDGNINSFEKNYYKDEEFFIAIQLMAKIPFLVIKSDGEPYEPLLKKVKKQFEIVKMMKFIDWICDEQLSGYFDHLEKDILSEEINTPRLNNLLLQFEEITK